MSLRRRLLFAAVLGTALAGCGSDSTGANASVVGTWSLTKFEFTNIANATQHTDIIAAGGQGAIVFNSNLTWSSAISLPGGGGSINGSGTYTETASTLTIVTNDQPPETTVFSKTVTSTTLTLTGGTVTFDFGAGDVPSHLSITATR